MGTEPWHAAIAAQQAQAQGSPLPPMLTRAEATAKASAYLRAKGENDVVVTARPNPVQGFWLISYGDPEYTGEPLCGGTVLVVPTDAPVHESWQQTPPWPEVVGMEQDEFSKWDEEEDVVPSSWADALGDELTKDYWPCLLEFVSCERATHDVYPPPSQTFSALELTPYQDVRVVILGQDPYPNPGQAHGLAFSVPVGVPVPPSLRNVHAVFQSDMQVTPPAHGNLEAWARQGVLLLNTALTVRAGSRHDRKEHRLWQRRERRGWEAFTDAVITAVAKKPDPVVFLLWGADARRKATLLGESPHKVIESSHPSPLSARHSFLASRPFSEANECLAAHRLGEIDWGAIGHTP